MRFEGHRTPTVGCEWELQIVRAGSLELADGILALLDQLGENTFVQPEYLQCCVEVNTPPCMSAAEIETALNAVMQRVRDKAEPLGLRLAAAGTHPFDKKLRIVTPTDRYLDPAAIHSMMPVQPATFATHVHVACPDGDSAVRAMARLTPCLPVLLALGANSPFWHGVHTGYASFRQRLLASNPTYGLPPYFADWAAFSDMLSAAQRSNAIRSFRDLHWDIRPHGDFGTLEFRVFDAQIDAHRVAQIAALTRALVVVAISDEPDHSHWLTRMPHWIELENHFRASKFGLDADLIVTAAGDTEPARRILGRLLAESREVAVQYGDAHLIEELAQSLPVGSGAVLQRHQWERHHSTKDVAGYLAQAISPRTESA